MTTSEIFHLIIGWFGLGLIVTALCGAGAFFVTAIIPAPLGTGLRRMLIEAAILSAFASTIYLKGYTDDHKQWDLALAAQIKVDEAAHAGAVADVASGVRDDRHDRDQHPGGLRAVAGSRLLGKK